MNTNKKIITKNDLIQIKKHLDAEPISSYINHDCWCKIKRTEFQFKLNTTTYCAICGGIINVNETENH